MSTSKAKEEPGAMQAGSFQLCGATSETGHWPVGISN